MTEPLELRVPKQFRKDKKTLGRRKEFDLTKLEEVVQCLQNRIELPAKMRPHKLHGDWNGCWECHIGSDWILIWRESETLIELVRTGTHADIF